MEHTHYLESPMFLLKRAYLAARKALDEGLQEHHLTGSQFEVLRHVLREDGLEQRLLQERLRVSSATVTGLVDGLVQRSLVQRVQHAEDARVKLLFATDQGRAIEESIRQKAAQVEEQLMAGFSTGEQELLKEWLRRMAANLGSAADLDCT